MKITDQYGVAGCVLLIEERFLGTAPTYARRALSKATTGNWRPAHGSRVKSHRNSRVQQNVPQTRSIAQSRFGGFAYRLAGLGLEA
jgi:hypothetical protein